MGRVMLAYPATWVAAHGWPDLLWVDGVWLTLLEPCGLPAIHFTSYTYGLRGAEHGQACTHLPAASDMDNEFGCA
jgi:hypothetical protein